jgi:hypothetical protein
MYRLKPGLRGWRIGVGLINSIFGIGENRHIAKTGFILMWLCSILQVAPNRRAGQNRIVGFCAVAGDEHLAVL